MRRRLTLRSLLFSAAVFLLLFLPATLVAHWLAPARARVPILLVASYVFYLSWNPIYGLLLAGSTVVNFTIARAIPGSARPRALLAIGVAANLLVLGSFKYVGFFSEGAASLLDWLGLAGTGSYDGLQILLPLAISFFTFEMISVLIDVYRGDVRVGGFLVFATYKAYFPKLIAGPITRYRELAPQLLAPRALSFERFQSGLMLFTLGLAKKLAIADNLAIPANRVFGDPGAQTPEYVAIGVVAFGLQIFFDFSAYSDMARGASRMLGLELPVNFRFPYGSSSPSEFWRRWHITLSRWLRDYLYIPLGGNRAGRARTYRNLVITMTLGGLWHGAGLQFLVWGAIHGLLLAVSHALRGRVQRPSEALHLLGGLVTLSAVFFAWIFFRADSLGEAADVIDRLAELPAALSVPEAVAGIAGACALVLANRWLPRLEAPARALLAGPGARTAAFGVATTLCWLAAMALAPSALTPFVYFEF
ncbi:MAG: MBOAT family protein [Solirubrobacteraceae bacterium]